MGVTTAALEGCTSEFLRTAWIVPDKMVNGSLDPEGVIGEGFNSAVKAVLTLSSPPSPDPVVVTTPKASRVRLSLTAMGRNVVKRCCLTSVTELSKAHLTEKLCC